MRISSAQPSTSLKASSISGRTSSTSSAVTIPVRPSIAIRSPSRRSRSPIVSVPRSGSILISEAPTTQGRPMPRATIAACEDLPPWAVRMPRAAWKPATSSAEVNERTRIESSPSAARSWAALAVSAIVPDAAPGDAGTPRVSSSNSASGAKAGWSRAVRVRGGWCAARGRGRAALRGPRRRRTGPQLWRGAWLRGSGGCRGDRPRS